MASAPQFEPPPEDGMTNFFLKPLGLGVQGLTILVAVMCLRRQVYMDLIDFDETLWFAFASFCLYFTFLFRLGTRIFAWLKLPTGELACPGWNSYLVAPVVGAMVLFSGQTNLALKTAFLCARPTLIAHIDPGGYSPPIPASPYKIEEVQRDANGVRWVLGSGSFLFDTYVAGISYCPSGKDRYKFAPPQGSQLAVGTDSIDLGNGWYWWSEGVE